MSSGLIVPGQNFVAAPALLNRPPQTRDELWWFVLACWGVAIPRQKVCPDHVAPFDAFAEAFFGEIPVSIWIGSRGFGGKTKTLSLLGMTEMVALGAFVTILGGSGQQSLRVHETMTEAWEHPGAPTGLLARDPTQLSTFLTNGAKARTLMASTKSVRGPHPQRMRLDEIDEMDLNVLESAQGQPMSTPKVKSQTVMSSTHQYPDGTVTAVLKRANELGWPVRRWCIAEGELITTARGEIPIQEVTSEDRVLTRQGWRKVQHVTFMGNKSTVTVKVGNRRLRCTPDHRIATADGGWRTASALAAHTVSSVGPDVRIFGSEGVSLPASVSAVLEPPSSGLVDAVGNDFHVGRIDTNSAPAQVVECQLVWDGANYFLPNPNMGLGSSPFSTSSNSFDSVSVAFSARPVDAVSGEHGDTIAVYDIGVEGVHEFVASGIVVHNCYKETSNPIDGWLNAEEVDRKRQEIPKHMWEAEYELYEPSFDNRAMDPEVIDKAFNLAYGYSDADLNKEVIVVSPQYNRDYVTAVDWAKSKDFTVVWTFDTTEEPWRTVAYARMGRRAWPEMVGYVNRRLNQYSGKLVHDATGIGSVVDDYIEIPDSMRPGDVKPVIMAGRARNDMITNYVSALENELIKSPRLKHPYEEHRFASVDDLYNGTSKAHLPDSIAAGALAWSLRSTWSASYAEPVSLTRPVSPWKIG